MPGVIDCHVHVVGPTERYPQSAQRHYTAAPAGTRALLAAAARHADRFVIVQPSFYGTDNRATLDAVAALGEAAHAVAVVDAATVGDATLHGLEAGGVRGVRINLNSVLLGDARRLADELAAQGEVARRRGWHLQLVLPFASLVEAAELIAAAPVRIVIDHFGLPIGQAPDSEGGRTPLGLAGLPHVWAKLSAPYRMLPDPLGTTPPQDWVAALLEAAPDRCVWGSDWPHTPLPAEYRGPDHAPPYRAIAYAALLADFVACLPAGMVDRVLRANAERLYGFAPVPEGAGA